MNSFPLRFALLLCITAISVRCSQDEHREHKVAAADTLVHNKASAKIETEESNSTEVILTQQEQILAGISTEILKLNSVQPTSTIVGTAALDERLVRVVSSRASGRIDRLYVRAWGNVLKKGMPIYGIYSESLLSAAKE